MYFIIILILLFIIFFVYNKKREKVVCLMYHSVYKKGITGIISTEEFERQMAYIKNKNTFKMEELEKLNYKLPSNSILVTFDDGYKNNYTEAFPILKKYGIKATIFINTKYIGENDYYLNWEQVREMYESGLVDFQLHTHSHGLTIRKPYVKGFYNDNSSPYFKRESYSLFFKGNYNNEKDQMKLNNLPIFKVRSQIALGGYRPVENFVEKYFELLNREDLKKLDEKGKREYLTKLFNENKENYFRKIDKKEYKNIVQFEIMENKRIIGKKLGKDTNVLAYPWGHRYKGHKKFLRDMGVDVFVTTKVGKNNLKLNKNFIYRVSGDDLTNINEFEKIVG